MSRLARLVLCALPLAWPGAGLAAEPADRNVLLVMMDDTGTDLFGAYGEVKAGMEPPPEHSVTPNIQEMADRGVRFENAWSNPLCSTTRATIMTGQHAFRNGLGNVGSLQPPAAAPTPYVPLAEHLGSAPARSLRSMIGKWHVTDYSIICSAFPPADPYTPVEAGFTQYQGNPDSGAAQSGWCEAVAGTGPTEPCDGLTEDATNWPPLCKHREAYETSAEVDRAIRFLDEAPPEPWFLQLSFHAVHATLKAPPPNLHDQEYILANYVEGETAALADQRAMQEAILQAMDTELGRLLDRLELYDCASDDCHLSRTTVILVGDNGTWGNVDLPTSVNRGAKSQIYEGGINVPLIVMGDAVHPARRGTSTPALVHTSDLYPTVSNMTGRVAAPTGVTIDGVSFASHLALENGAAPRSCVYADGIFGGAARNQHNTAVRNATHKLIRLATQAAGVTGYQFYGLGADGHLDETTTHMDGELEVQGLPIPTDSSDPSWESYQQLLAQLEDSVASPCKPPPPSGPPPGCGFGPELAPVLLLLARLRRRYSTRPDLQLPQ